MRQTQVYTMNILVLRMWVTNGLGLHACSGTVCDIRHTFAIIGSNNHHCTVWVNPCDVSIFLCVNNSGVSTDEIFVCA
jgi:hypothetical protein